MERKLTTQDFIERARAAHGDKYDYSKSQYTKRQTKTTVTCPYHGDFLVAPGHHWNGTGCTVCSGKRQLTTAEFIKRSAKAHGDRYDYTNSVYVSDGVKVNIVCREHGQFSQPPRSHYGGAGCPKCAGCARVTFSDFVKRSRAVHKDRYIYPPQRLLSTHQKVTIICRDHGEFSQTAKGHMIGRGCSRCTWDRSQPTSVYLLKMGRLVKVGISIDPEVRLATLNKTNPSPATLLDTWLLPDFPAAQKIEFATHAALANRHAGLAGFDGATEWFHVSPSYAANIIDRLIAGDPCQLSFKFLAA